MRNLIALLGISFGFFFTHSSARAQVDEFAQVSPDGSKIVFMSNRRGFDQKYDLYVIAATGGEMILLTDDGDGESYRRPSWSPDGEQIYFASNGNSETFDIYSMNSDGADKQLVVDSDTDLDYPIIHPDNEHIAYVQYNINEENERVSFHVRFRNLNTDNDITVYGPYEEANGVISWGPEGEHLYFYEIIRSVDPDGVLVLHRINLATAEDVSTPGVFYNEGGAAISPNGDWFVIGADTSEIDHGARQWNIWMRDFDGRKLRQITMDDTTNWGPTWFPSGRSILYTGITFDGQHAVYNLYRIDIDGENHRQITFPSEHGMDKE